MSQYSLVGDIGGTNARFALVEGNSRQLLHVHTLQCADYENVHQACEAYLAKVGVPSVSRACLAFACPVDGDVVKMTNNHWCFEPASLKQFLNLDELKLLNDFTAQALGMLEVSASDLMSLEKGRGQAKANAPKLVIGPGTGLGVSALVPASGSWVPLATEGGHVSFAPTDDLEVQIWQFLNARFSRVSAERLLCGQGLVNIYEALCHIHNRAPKPLSPADITGLAVSREDELAYLALSRFCRLLGSVVGDAVLTLGAKGGVYLCGGILPRVKDFLLQSEFFAGMESKGRFKDYLGQVPVWLCTAEQPGLLGAAAGLSNPHV